MIAGTRPDRAVSTEEQRGRRKVGRSKLRYPSTVKANKDKEETHQLDGLRDNLDASTRRDAHCSDPAQDL